MAAQEAARHEPASPQIDPAEQIMADAPLRLSQLTRMTGMLLAPPLGRTALARIELVALGDDRALAVIVTDTGWITARPISAPRLGTEELREIGRGLARRYRGKTFAQILDDVASPTDPLDPLWTRTRSLLDQIAALFRERTLYLSGATHILDHPDLSDPATMRPLLRAFEDKARLIDLLSQMAGGARRAGHDRQRESPRGHARVQHHRLHVYLSRPGAGVLGVVGPRRMAYSDVMALVDETARLVSSSLSRVKQQLYLPS